MGMVSRAEGGEGRRDRRHDLGRRARGQGLRVHELTARAAMPSATPIPPPSYPRKIVAGADALARIAALPRPLVMTNGVFDVLHRGHVTYLDQARGLGAALVVAVNSDASVRRLGKGDDRPLNPLADRMAVLAALEAVDLVVSVRRRDAARADRRHPARHPGQGRRLQRRDHRRRRRGDRRRRTFRGDSLRVRSLDHGAGRADSPRRGRELLRSSCRARLPALARPAAQPVGAAMQERLIHRRPGGARSTR